MAAENFDEIMVGVFKLEGGYVDHPKDPGGATNLGVTFRVLQAYRGRPITKQDVRALTKPEAKAIYKKQYWDKVWGDELPAGVDHAMFDFCVNSGPARAIRTAQKVAGVSQDGVMGQVTLDAIQAMDAALFIERYCAERLAFMKRLDTWKTFGKGWQRRVNAVKVASLAMASHRPAAAAVHMLPDLPDDDAGTVKASPTDRAVRTTDAGATAWITGGGGAAGAIGLVSDKLDAFSDIATVRNILLLLTFLGIAITIGGAVWAWWRARSRIKAGETQ